MNLRAWRPFALALAVLGLMPSERASAQEASSPPALPLVQLQGASAAPVTLTLQDALDRAKANDAQFQSAAADVQIARGDRVQARASLLPTFSHTTQWLGTQANGVRAEGRFVTNDGTNVYRSWMVAHQDISSNTLTAAPIHRAQAAEAVAEAKLEIAQRGLKVTVTKDYYALVTAQRKYATAQLASEQAMRFLEISQQQERLGQAAHSDAVKAELQYQQQLQGYQDAALAMENARLMLAVLIFPTLSENFTVVDDLTAAPALPPFADVRGMAERANPDLRVANETLRGAQQDVRLSRNALLPSLAIDAVYGIEANYFALHSPVSAAPEFGSLPNLGYFITANVTVPLWDWGGLHSKLSQSRTRERQAEVELSQAQRQAVSNLYAMYNEATAARAAVDNLRRAADLATESLRLTNLRYQAGESTALEVVDAQNTLVQVRNGYDDAESRYRLALATLQMLTGSF